MTRSPFVFLALLAGLAGWGIAPLAEGIRGSEVAESGLPLGFEENRGQAAPGVRYLARGSGFRLSITDAAAVIDVPGTEWDTLRLTFVGAAGRPVADEPLSGRVHYLIGSDPDRWITDVSTYAAARFAGLYPGVDLVVRGDRRRIGFEWRFAPLADPDSVVLGLDGSSAVRLEPSGDVLTSMRGSGVRHDRPVAFQQVDGERIEIEVGFVVLDGDHLGLALGAYDSRLPLWVRFAATSAGSDTDRSGEEAREVRVASSKSGDVYLTSRVPKWLVDATRIAATAQEAADTMVTKLGPDGSSVVFTTYIGGEGDDAPAALGVDAAGRVVVAGTTTSEDFPITAGGRKERGGRTDGFVVRLREDGGGLVHATRVGGAGDDAIHDLSLDRSGAVWLAGTTDGLGRDAFVLRVEADGRDTGAASVLGGSGDDEALGVLVDEDGRVHVVGTTASFDFPLVRPIQDAHGGGRDAFVATIDPRGGGIVFSSVLGGTGDDVATSVALDAEGRVLLTGSTSSPEFPVTVEASLEPRTIDAFVVRVDLLGPALDLSARIGGRGNDRAQRILADDDGRIWLAGTTDSTDFPRGPEPGLSPGGRTDAFVARIDADGRLRRTDFVGGAEHDLAGDVTLVAGQGAVVAGRAGSLDRSQLVPIEPAASGGDAFLAPIGIASIAAAGCPGTVNFDDDNGNGLWQEAANWDTDTLPASIDDVCIDGFAVTLSAGAHRAATVTVNNGSLALVGGSLALGGATVAPGGTALFLNGGTLAGTGSVTIAGPTDWRGGTMTGSGVTETQGALALTLAGVRDLTDGRKLRISGGATYSGTNLRMGPDALIENSGLFVFAADGDINSLGGTARFDNRPTGIVRKSGGTGLSTITQSFDNAGSVQVQSGTLAFGGGGTSTSSFVSDSGATLSFSAGTHEMSAGAQITGTGNVLFDGGVVSFNSGSSLSKAGGITSIAGATVNVATSAGFSASAANFSSGTLGGPGTATIHGPLSWTAGVMVDAGITEALGGMTISGASVKDVTAGRTLRIAGSATYSGTNLRMGADALIENSGLFDFAADGDINSIFGGTARFDNRLTGIVRKSGGTGLSTITRRFHNAGSVQVQSGTLNFDDGGTSSGSFASDPGATLSFNGGTHEMNAGAQFTGTGNVLYDSGVVSFNSGSSLSKTGGITSIAGATVNVAASAGFSTSAVDFSAGTLGGTGTATIHGPLSWTAGGMVDAGITEALGGMTISGASVKDVTAGRTLRIAGSATYSGTNLRMGPDALIENNGLFDFAADGDINSILGGTARFDNRPTGIVRKSAGAGSSNLARAMLNSGIVESLVGVLQFTGGYTQIAGVTRLNGGSIDSTATLEILGGALAGFGTLVADVSIAGGEASPGLSPDVLNIDGNYLQSDSGSYRVDLNGTAPGPGGHDQINLINNHAATLAGDLRVSLVGYAPQNGDTVTIVTFASRVGAFSRVDLPPLNPGLNWSLDYGPTSVVLRATAACADADGDNYADCVGGCVLGTSDQCGDCDDSDFTIRPGATEVCNAADDDCDGSVDEGLGLGPELCNGLDDNCNGLTDEGNPQGGADCAVGGELGICDEGTATCLAGGLTCLQDRGPGPEVCGNGLDDDCDGQTDEAFDDTDGDGVSNCIDDCPDAFNPPRDCDGLPGTPDGQCDGDGDGIGDECDCTPAPQAVGDSVRIAKGPVADCDNDPATPDVRCTLTGWGAVSGIDDYHVYRGYLNQGTGFSYNQQCLASNVTGTSMTEPLDPNPHTVFFYLVTSKCPVGASESSLGFATGGAARLQPFVCPDPTRDVDGDGTEEAIDNCPGFFNDSQADVDGDFDGDVCDNCPQGSNPSQGDLDVDGLGDACDPDRDGDSVLEDDGDATVDPCTGGITVSCDDNCPDTSNPGQEDQDGDRIGDACDSVPLPQLGLRCRESSS